MKPGSIRADTASTRITKPGDRTQGWRPDRRRQLGRRETGDAHSDDGDDQPELERAAHLGGALRPGRRPEQAYADYDADHRKPFPQREPCLHQPRREHRGHSQVGGHDCLHGEQRQPAQCHQLGDETHHIDCDTGQEWSLPQHAYHRPGSTPVPAAPSAAVRWLAARTAIACMTAATP